LSSGGSEDKITGEDVMTFALQTNLDLIEILSTEIETESEKP